ncbi:MAG: hypothetical protein R6V11_06100 [Ectothiorhodospiraceae bacterium]
MATAAQQRGTRPATGRGERLVALFVLGLLLFNPPLLSLVDGRGSIGGVPVIYAYLFMIWLGLITGTALITRAPRR